MQPWFVVAFHKSTCRVFKAGLWIAHSNQILKSFLNFTDIAPIKIISYKQKRISFHFCGEDWPSAQTLCIRRGGNLWEPSSDREFEFTFQAIGHVSGNQIPIWYHKFASWWIGSVKSPLYNGKIRYIHKDTLTMLLEWIRQNSPRDW